MKDEGRDEGSQNSGHQKRFAMDDVWEVVEDCQDIKQVHELAFKITMI